MVAGKLSLLFRGTVETEDAVAFSSGLCLARRDYAGLQESACCSCQVGLLFHSIATWNKELWTWGLNTRLVPSAFHQVAAASSRAAYASYVQLVKVDPCQPPKPNTSLASVSLQIHKLRTAEDTVLASPVREGTEPKYARFPELQVWPFKQTWRRKI